LNRLGSTTYSKLELGGEGSFLTEGDFNTTITASGKIYSFLVDKDENFYPIRQRFVTYNDLGQIQTSIDVPSSFGSVKMNDRGEIIAIADWGPGTGRLVKWDGAQWQPMASLNLPQGTVPWTIWDYNAQGTIVGEVYGHPSADPGYPVVWFYATEVPEPGSALVMGGLLIGLGSRLYRFKKRRHVQHNPNTSTV
jgi:hypothetical protein